MRRFGLTLGVLLIGLHSAPSHAVSRDVKTVITTSIYGAIGGTALGLASLPFTHDSKAVFIGTSVGLYLGIMVGLYHINHRDDPGNPLADLPPGMRKRDEAPVASADFRFPVLEF